MAYRKVRDGVFFHPTKKRLVEHHGMSTRIFWSPQMIAYLRENFATSFNKDLAEWLGVSIRTVVRKARELGLQKDEDWINGVWNEHQMMARAASRRKGFPGAFKKGTEIGSEYRYKPGHKSNPEWEKKRVEGLRRWYRLHPEEVRERNRKVTASREARRKGKSSGTEQQT